jgi:N-acetylneuraminate synthase
MRTLIIAEAGVNHNGDIAMARALVAAAAAAGADMVKFQTFVAGRSIVTDAPKAPYQQGAGAQDESQYEMVRKLELSRRDHELLIAECSAQKIGFLSTAFDVESFDLLMALGVGLVKIPSGEITNLPFLRHAAASGKPMLLSTGMASLGDVEAALDAIEVVGTPRDRVTILHCNTAYPTPMRDVNLQALCSMRTAFGVDTGYSDHTTGIEVAVAAVALGATVIEKHFTLDRTLPGPDHKASLEPGELKAMVAAIRNVEQALGDGIKRATASELENRPVARKSIVASRAIRAGELFSAENMTTKRPGSGISPMRWDEMLGRRAPRDFAADELIEP